jgi:2Fe-2S ferredoxin
MLDFVWELGPCSRLTCQIPVTPELDGLLLRVPRRQL